jgi:threonine synthase
MDISKLVAELSAELGVAEIIKKQIAHLGVSPKLIEEFTKDTQDILADGKITKEEVIAKIRELAEAKGIPASVSGAVAGMIAEKTPAKPEPENS